LQFLSQLLLVTKPQKLKKLKLLCRYFSVDERIYWSERSEAKYKAQSEEKGRQLDAEIKRFKQDAANFQSQGKANGQI
jgi:hypothetical protein